MGTVIELSAEAERNAQYKEALERAELAARFSRTTLELCHGNTGQAVDKLADMLAAEIIAGRHRLTELGKEHAQALEAMRQAHQSEIESEAEALLRLSHDS